jgi:hypothetical protein
LQTTKLLEHLLLQKTKGKKNNMLEARINGNKKFTHLSNLRLWENNPRKLDDADFERLKRQVQNLGQYKPLIVTEDGVIIGGNMRFRAMEALGFTEAWITELGFAQVDLPVGSEGAPRNWRATIDGVIQDKEFESKEQLMLEYALSDNDQAGYYDQQALAELIIPFEDKLGGDYKFELGKPVDMKPFLEQYRGDNTSNGTNAENEEDKDKAIAIILKFTPDQYKDLEPRLRQVKASMLIENNTDLFLRLLASAENGETITTQTTTTVDTSGNSNGNVPDAGVLNVEQGSSLPQPITPEEGANADATPNTDAPTV